MKLSRFAAALLSLLLVAAPALARQAPAVVDAARLREHVAYLASEKLEGRRTGTRGADEAARYVEREFRRLGLRPAGDPAPGREGDRRLYTQQFPYVAGVELGKGNVMTATRRPSAHGQGAPRALDLRAGEDWMPLGFGSNGEVEAKVVFVGYGISAAEQNHDDYKGVDAAGRVALAFSGTPEGDDPHGRLRRAGEARFRPRRPARPGPRPSSSSPPRRSSGATGSRCCATTTPAARRGCPSPSSRGGPRRTSSAWPATRGSPS
ncbi:MAG TPA: hypothetical protein VEY09_14070 [Pyrinomonadaceae bacterium]|nr:hypothetical protein [Pyrinomonadaceae bacterium]